VLLATATSGQRRAGLAESADLPSLARRGCTLPGNAQHNAREGRRQDHGSRAVLTLAALVTVLVTSGASVSAAATTSLEAGARWSCSPRWIWLESARSVAGVWLWRPGRTAVVSTGRGPLLWRSSAWRLH